MPAPTFVSSGATVSGTASVSAAWGAGHQAGDIGLLVIETGGNGSTLTPSGWAHVPGSPVVDVASAAGSKLHVLWRRAVSGAEANVPTGDSGDHQVAKLFVFKGCKAGDPWDVVQAGIKATASATATLPAVTTTVADTLVALICGRPNDSNSNTHFGLAVNANLSDLGDAGEAGSTAGRRQGRSLALPKARSRYVQPGSHYHELRR